MTVAAALLLAGGLFIVFVVTMSVLGRQSIHTAASPTRGEEAFGSLLFGLVINVLLGLWAIVTAIGIFRLRKWARISILALSGFSAVSIAFALAIGIWAMPRLMEAQGRDTPTGVMTFLAVILVAVAGIPLGCSIWWLVLFLRKSVREQFEAKALEPEPSSVTREVAASRTPDAAAPAVPAPPAAEMARPLKIPTSIYVIAIYLLATSAVGLLGLPFAGGRQMPSVLLGIPVTGWKAWASHGALMALQLALGTALLRTR